MEKKTDAKAKKEKKFNSERVARLVKNSLNAVFPKDNFIVNTMVEYVEVMYFDNTSCSVAELNMFGTLFCNMSNLKKEKLLFSKVIRAPAVVPAPAVSK